VAASGCLGNSSNGSSSPDASAPEDGGGAGSLDGASTPDAAHAQDAAGSSDGAAAALDAASDTGASNGADGGVACGGDGGPGTFTCVGDLGTAREAAGLAALAGGKALVAGGWNATTGALTSAEIFDSTTGTFTPTGAMAAPHLWGEWGGAWPTLANGDVLIAGGLDDTGAVLSSAELYDPTTGAFVTTGPLKTGVIALFPIVLANQSILFIGGWTSTTGSPPTPAWSYTGSGSSEVQQYTPASGAFTDTGPLAEGRFVGCNALLSTGQVLAIGGSTGPSTSESNIEQYDPTSGKWTTVSVLTGTVTACAQAFTLTNGKVLLLGTNTAENADTLDPTTFATAATTGFPMGWVPYYVQLASGDVLAYGGTLSSTPTAMAMVYRAASNTWEASSPMGEARSGATSAVVLTTGDVLVLGGVDATSAALKTAEVYHP
jgi:hypothetical protein